MIFLNLKKNANDAAVVVVIATAAREYRVGFVVALAMNQLLLVRGF